MPNIEIRSLLPQLFRVRIPGQRAHLLNSYFWLGPDGVTIVDTGWAESAEVLKDALAQLGQRPADVGRVILTHFHEDHVGSAAEVASWSESVVVAGREDADLIRGLREGPAPTLTPKEAALMSQMSGGPTPAVPPTRVDQEVDDGDVLDFAGGAIVLHLPGHTDGSIGIYLPKFSVVLAGDAVAEFQGQVILGTFNTNRERAQESADRIVDTGAQIAGFGHGEAIVGNAAKLVADRTDPFL